ncbi:gustatory and odorant receptor 63a [Melanaphis sacchari]|uniref:gustatory and odorant receptor 63a n=1 Tax=Melanaphis sacchari TaxID=742174 RepID=UPI000DC146F0|nr:gustatory and odorant receptor 63a [Melanaphis sacchari]
MSTVDDVPAAMCSFFDHLCGPFFAAFRILGVCPYTRNSNGVFHKRIVSASSVYTLFSGAAFGYATFVAIKTLSGQPPPIAMSNFNHILLKFGYATLIAPSAIVPVIMWFETTKLQAYLHEWQLFQDNYNRVVGKSNSIAMIAIVKKRVNRIYRSILVFLSITVVAISWSSSTISDVYVLFCTIRSVSIMVFIVGFWFVGAIAIEATIDGYKKKLQTDLDGRHSFGFGARSIEDYRLLWLQLSRLVHGVGDYMSATVTFCIFHTTVLVVLSVYAVAVWGATLVRLRRYEALASASVALVCNATSLYVYCDCGYSQTRKVGYRLP